MDFSSSDSEEDMITLDIFMDDIPLLGCTVRHGGSHPGRSANICRDNVMGDRNITRDYFSGEDSIFPEPLFRRRFRMSPHLFDRIMQSVVKSDPIFFSLRIDAFSKTGISPLQRCTAALRLLAYGSAADACDEYIRISETSAILSMYAFCKGVVEAFEEEYLRGPTAEDTQRLLSDNAARGFPGMLGSIDCMHWQWRNCPSAHHGQYIGKDKTPTIVLEAIASQDLWIWHAFFGTPGSCNDINIIDRSPLVTNMLLGTSPPCAWELDGERRTSGYWLADGIYPRWPIFIQSFTEPQGLKRRNFATKQEAARKDIERAFGVLQARFHILCRPSRMWYHERMAVVMRACIIMHNMIVEEQRVTPLELAEEDLAEVVQLQSVEAGEDTDGSAGRNAPDDSVAGIIERLKILKDEADHEMLRNKLIEHLWQWKGNNE